MAWSHYVTKNDSFRAVSLGASRELVSIRQSARGTQKAQGRFSYAPYRMGKGAVWLRLTYPLISIPSAISGKPESCRWNTEPTMPREA